MSFYYDKIMSQTGMAEFKEMIKKWRVLSEGVDAIPSGLPIVLPDIFLVSYSGSGRTHMLKLLSEYLSAESNLMEFYGDVKFFEFMLNYCRPDEPFTEIQRLMDEVDNAAGFRNEYKGIVYIDIDEWIGHCEEKHFISFLEYLSDNSDSWLVVLSVSDGDREKINTLEAIVSAFLRIELITVEAPSPTDLVNYIRGLLSAYGFSLDETAAELLCDSLDVLRKNEYFDSYKTAKKLCQDIVYSIYASGNGAKKNISSEDISAFSADGEYINRTVKKIERVKRVGF